MIEVKTVIDSNVQKELNFKAFLVSLIMLILGSVGIVCYIIFSVITTKYETILFYVLLLSAVCFVVGLIGVITIKNVNKKAAGRDCEVKLIFEEDYYIINEFRNNEQVATVKIFYKDVLKTRETKNYFFIYQIATVAHPIKKSELSIENLTLIKNYIKQNKA